MGEDKEKYDQLFFGIKLFGNNSGEDNTNSEVNPLIDDDNKHEDDFEW